jgi:CRP/FNR family transcriptional regulator
MNKIPYTFFKKIQLFADLTAKQLSILASESTLCDYKKGDIVFSEGEIKDVLYIVFTGKVKLFKLSSHGKEQIIHIYGPYHLFAEVAIFEEKSMPANCSTIEKTTLVELPKKTLLTLIHTDPSIAFNMLAMQAKRLRFFTQKIENLALQDANQRLIHYLISQIKNPTLSKTFTLSISKTTLALLLGISRENLSRTLKKLQTLNLIKVNRQKFTLININKLRTLVQQQKINE